MFQKNQIKTMSVLLLSSLVISQIAFAKGGSVSASKSGSATHSNNSKSSSKSQSTTATKASTQASQTRPANHAGSTIQKPTAGVNIHPSVAPVMSAPHTSSTSSSISVAANSQANPSTSRTSAPVRVRDSGGRGAAAAAAMLLQAENQKAQADAQRAQSSAQQAASAANDNGRKFVPERSLVQKSGENNSRIRTTPVASVPAAAGAKGSTAQGGGAQTNPDSWVKDYQNILAKYQKTPNEIGPNWTEAQAAKAMNDFYTASYQAMPKSLQDAALAHAAVELTAGALTTGDSATARAVAQAGLAAAQRALNDATNPLSGNDKTEVSQIAASFNSMLSGNSVESSQVAAATGAPSTDRSGKPTLTYKVPGLGDTYLVAGDGKPATLVSKNEDGSLTQRVLDSHGISEVRNEIGQVLDSNSIKSSSQYDTRFDSSGGTVTTKTSPSGLETSVTISDSSGTSTYHEASNTITTAAPGSTYTYSVPSSGGMNTNNNSTDSSDGGSGE